MYAVKSSHRLNREARHRETADAEVVSVR